MKQGILVRLIGRLNFWSGLTLVALVGIALIGAIGHGQDTEKTVEELLPVTRAPYSPIKLQIGLIEFIGAGDFDKDGNVDLIVVTKTPGGEPAGSIWKSRIFLLRSDEKGGYSSDKCLYEVENTPQGGLGGLAVDDLNFDGNLDFAITDLVNGGTWVFWGDGTGEFTKEFLQLETKLVFPRVLSVDLNSDGFPDLVSSEATSKSIYVFWGAKQNRFKRVTKFSFPKGYIPMLLAPGDFDEDGHTDLAVLGWRWTEEAKVIYFVSVTSTAGTEDLKLLSTVDIGEPASPEAIALAVGDYNEDGHLDVVTVRHRWAYALFGDGKGRFQEEKLYMLFDPVVPQVILADLDQDGCLNDVVLGMSTGRVWISTGCYGETRYILPVLMEGTPGWAVVTDVNNDGVPDLVIGTSMWPDWTYLELLLGKPRG